MDPVVTDNRDRSRFEITVGDTVAGYAQYKLGDEEIVFTHTEVDDAFSGQGLAKVLAREALDAARGAGLSVIPLCPFVARFVQRNREYADLVPESRREEFDLS